MRGTKRKTKMEEKRKDYVKKRGRMALIKEVNEMILQRKKNTNNMEE